MYVNEKTINIIRSMAKEYGATQIFLFGSALENPAEVRDIDIACDGVAGWKLFELAAQLEDTLRIHFDLVPLTPSSRLTRHIASHSKRLI